MPAKSIPIAKTCENCGSQYSVKPSIADSSRFCCRQCKDAAVAKKRIANRPIVICDYCKVQFSLPASLAERRKYCSYKCAWMAKTGQRRTHPLTCTVCGVEFYSKRKTAAYCSSKCYGIAQKGSVKPDAAHRTVSRGYVYLLRPEHPFANTKGYVAEHRLVAEKTIGRLLRNDEIVHHIDEDRGNNDPSNLQVMTQREHVRLHHSKS